MVRPDSKEVLGLQQTLDAQANIHNGVNYEMFAKMATKNADDKRRSTVASIARTMGVNYHTAVKYVNFFDKEQSSVD